MSSPLLGAIAALASAASWALGSVLWRKVGDNLSASSMNLAKGVIGSLYLLIPLMVLRLEPVSLQAVLYLGISGVVGIAIGDTLFFVALLNLGPRLTSLMSTLTPVATALVAVVALGERPSLSVWLGIALTCTGVAWVLSRKTYGSALVRDKRRGVIAAILSVVSTVIGVILAKKALAQISAVQASFLRMLAGTIGLAIWGIARGELRSWLEPLRDPRYARKIAGIMLLATFGGFFLSLYALKLVDASIATSLNSTAPLFVIPFAAWVLREKWTVHSVWGAAVAVCGVVFILSG